MTETKASPLRWTKTTFNGSVPGYSATDDTFGYTLARQGGGWCLQARPLIEVAGVKTAVGQPLAGLLLEDTAKLCKLVAAEHSAFGAEFNEDDHGGKSRMTAAACIIYAREREGTLR